jgi:hypothetical protein
MENLKKSLGTNWTPNNLRTVLNWVNFSSFMIEGLEESINRYRGKIRFNTILGLILSTASGTISVAQYAKYVSQSLTGLVLNAIFTLFTFVIAINTGYIKIYQIQERLELFIKTKQEWTSFTCILGAELDLPINMRKDALDLITCYKENYLNLMNIDYELPHDILDKIKVKMDKQFTEEQNIVIQKSRGLKVYNVLGSKVERLADMLFNLHKLKGYRHDKNLLDIIKENEELYLDVEYGNIKSKTHVPTEINFNYNKLYAAPQPFYLDILKQNIKSAIDERTKILTDNFDKAIFNDENKDKMVELTEYINELQNNYELYKDIPVTQESIDAFNKEIIHIIKEINSSEIFTGKYYSLIYKKDFIELMIKMGSITLNIPCHLNIEDEIVELLIEKDKIKFKSNLNEKIKFKKEMYITELSKRDISVNTWEEVYIGQFAYDNSLRSVLLFRYKLKHECLQHAIKQYNSSTLSEEEFSNLYPTMFREE